MYVWILGLKRSIFFSFLTVNFTPTADAILSDALFKSFFFNGMIPGLRKYRR